MKFHCCERQLGDDVCCVKHHLAGLARESEYEVGAAVESVAVDEFDGVAGLCVINFLILQTRVDTGMLN